MVVHSTAMAGLKNVCTLRRIAGPVITHGGNTTSASDNDSVCQDADRYGLACGHLRKTMRCGSWWATQKGLIMVNMRTMVGIDLVKNLVNFVFKNFDDFLNVFFCIAGVFF